MCVFSAVITASQNKHTPWRTCFSLSSWSGWEVLSLFGVIMKSNLICVKVSDRLLCYSLRKCCTCFSVSGSVTAESCFRSYRHSVLKHHMHVPDMLAEARWQYYADITDSLPIISSQTHFYEWQYVFVVFFCFCLFLWKWVCHALLVFITSFTELFFYFTQLLSFINFIFHFIKKIL